ncbi:unnamed protein product, partial [Scytosiphon promiscuus]
RLAAFRIGVGRSGKAERPPKVWRTVKTLSRRGHIVPDDLRHINSNSGSIKKTRSVVVTEERFNAAASKSNDDRTIKQRPNNNSSSIKHQNQHIFTKTTAAADDDDVKRSGRG